MNEWNMLNRVLLIVAMGLLFYALPGGAEPIQFEKVLLPIALQAPVKGANGSIFETRFSLLNAANQAVAIRGYDRCGGISLCIDAPTPPGATFYPQLNIFNSEIPAFFMYVDEMFVRDVKMGLRVQDVSRQSQTWGTEIPVVPSSRAFTAKSELLDIPIGPDFRLTLRVYDFDPAPERSATIRFFGINEDTRLEPVDLLLLTMTRTFRIVTTGGSGASHPGYIEVSGIASIPELAGHTRVRIEIEPVTAGLRYWAFVSVTNNDTQHITTITPH